MAPSAVDTSNDWGSLAIGSAWSPPPWPLARQVTLYHTLLHIQNLEVMSGETLREFFDLFFDLLFLEDFQGLWSIPLGNYIVCGLFHLGTVHI